MDLDDQLFDIGFYLASEFNAVLDELELEALSDLGLIVARLGEFGSNPNMRAALERHVADCQQALAHGQFAQAVTAARVLVEHVLYEVERELDGADPPRASDLQSHYKRVNRRLNLDPNEDRLRALYGTLLRGLVSTVQGVAELRNSAGGVHASHTAAKVVEPKARHARLAVNAAYTLATFLAETFEHQVKTGRVAVHSQRS